MFITPALAQAPGGGGSDFMLQLVPILLMFVIFYFLLFRPQQQRAKQHREMVNNLRRGEVEVADQTRIRVVKSTVAEVRTKGEPVKEGA
jgi:preprotein translocase subunit YajC